MKLRNLVMGGEMIRSRAHFFVGIILSISTLACTNAEAALSVLSRANCLTYNESVSWDPTGPYNWLWTYSQHYQNGIYQHLLQTGWEFTWRSYAGDNHSSLGWAVYGTHYRWSDIIGTYWLGSTTAYDCNPLSW